MNNKIAIVASQFNPDICKELYDSCLKTLKAARLTDEQITTVLVPGAFEIPWTVNELALSEQFAVVITIGCILKGQTPQNHHISQSVIQSLHQISIQTRVPIVLGVITPNTYAQAKARTKGKLNRGAEAAHAALNMLTLKNGFPNG